MRSGTADVRTLVDGFCFGLKIVLIWLAQVTAVFALLGGGYALLTWLIPDSPAVERCETIEVGPYTDEACEPIDSGGDDYPTPAWEQP